jgi:hypothetical protein
MRQSNPPLDGALGRPCRVYADLASTRTTFTPASVTVSEAAALSRRYALCALKQSTISLPVAIHTASCFLM